MDRAREAAQQLQALLVRQVLEASGAFRPGEAAGSQVRSDLFLETLADALARSDAMGLSAGFARLLESPAPSAAPSPRETSLAAPLSDARLTSGFGARADPIDGHAAQHGGIDLAAPAGTLVHAAASGVVVRAGDRGGYGQAVEIDHGGGTTTLYAHASELLVHPGDRVEKGSAIARVGHSGRATGDHLHFEVRSGGTRVDPARALNAYRNRVDDGGAGTL